MSGVVMKKTRVAKTFYAKRSLAQPQTEWWPSNAGELREALAEPGRPKLLLGDGQHTRPPAIGAASYEVIRTERCNRVMSVDRESKLVRVETGLRWGELQAQLAERGLSTERYALYPQQCTLGGLLGRLQPVHREAWDAALTTGCVAMTTTSDASDYRYIAAPRKSSGPDLRWLYIGSEGALGAILDATFVVSDPAAGRLLTFRPERFGQAATIVQTMWDLGIRPSWTHWVSYKSSSDELSIALHGHERLVDASATALIEACAIACEVGGSAEIAAKRAELEASHPDRRSLATSIRTVRAIVSTRDLPHAIGNLPEGVESASIWAWTRHVAHLYIRYARGEASAELPAQIQQRALDIRPVADDEAVRWSRAARSLKQLLDRGGALAVGEHAQ